MNTLTATIAVPQVTRLSVRRFSPDLDANAADIIVQAQSGGGLVYGTYTLTARNGTSVGIRGTITPAGYSDRVEVFSLATATAFTDLLTAWAGAGAGLAAKLSAIETALIAAGMMPAGTVT